MVGGPAGTNRLRTRCSVPARWMGSQVDVRGDRSLVPTYVRGELIKAHEWKPFRSRSTDYNDYPDDRVGETDDSAPCPIRPSGVPPAPE